MSDERKRMEKIKRLEEGIMKCREYKKKIERFSSRLSKDYRKGRMDRAEYEENIKKHLQGIYPEQWADYYETKSRGFSDEIKKIASSGAVIYNKNTKTVAICGFLLFMLVGMLVGNYAKITGFASFESADVFTGKETYNIGEMVHIFVVPGDAERTVEVYDSENNMIAVSEDFPAEKPGKYTIKASVKIGEGTKEVSATFSVAGNKDEETINDQETSAAGLSTPTNAYQNNSAAAGVQIAGKVNDTIKDGNDDVVGRKIEDEKDYETIFTLVGRLNGSFVIEFHHNSTIVQPVWVEAEGGMQYNLSTLAADPNETVVLTIPLDSQQSLPKFRLHVGLESEVFEFDIEGASGAGTVLGKEIDFSKADMVEESALDENNNSIAVTKIEKDGLSINIGGAGKDEIKNVNFSKGILHVDPIPIKDAEISMPHKLITGVMVAPKLYIKEDNETKFRIAEPYTKDSKRFNEIKVTPSYYEFNVEHFTDYYVESGGDYETLTDCLLAINDTEDTCVIAQEGLWDIDDSYMFHLASNAITIASPNVILNCGGSTINGDGTGAGIRYDEEGGNITIEHCNVEGFDTNFVIYGGGDENSNIVILNCTSGSANYEDSFDYANFTIKQFNQTDGMGISLSQDASYSGLLEDVLMTGCSAADGEYFSCMYIEGASNYIFRRINLTTISTPPDSLQSGVIFAAGSSDNIFEDSYINANRITALNITSDSNYRNIIRNTTIEDSKVGLNIQTASNDVINNTIRATR
ncbi:MAG: right-handed parallel beta-helix repeat-containing protein [Candidatus Woesearchaeota archaeon]|nr:right-handed parallel beta-helix repeat-containing protein [Candidatus Woesearchaeota archaeon]